MTPFEGILRASYHTLGCKLNFSETSAIRSALLKKGIIPAERGQTPDICIVNTCSVTAVADKKAKSLIRGLARKFPDAMIIVTGCYAQLKPEEASELPGVKLVVGSEGKLKISDFIDKILAGEEIGDTYTSLSGIKTFHATCERGERTRYFLKVQDGCNYYCTYCTIPMARGRSRSGNISDMTDLARKAVSEGAKEIVLTGINVGEFGRDHGESFSDLIKSLDAIEGIERFRISSIEPNLLTEDIISWIANESKAFLPHFHIPLQSGSDVVLKLMRRRYDTALFRRRIEFIRKLMPEAFIGVDIIAGARGETDEEWQKSLDFAESLDVSRFHVFPYSEREGTKALSIEGVVPQEEKHHRVSLLTALSDKKHYDFIARNSGTKKMVLWETRTSGEMMQGFSENYIRVEAPFKPELLHNVSEVILRSRNEINGETIRANHI